MSKRYWLFKAEPHIYGIDHLAAAPAQTGRWDGIRNYQARNFLRDQVTLGDEVFIYHSSCKQVGIVGTAVVASAPYADPTQFNPESPYYDPKASIDAPRWVAVDITLQQKFASVIPLATLKLQAPLSEMTLLKQGRLSTQPVSASEWDFIIKMAR